MATPTKRGTFQDWNERNATLHRIAEILPQYEWNDRGLVNNPGKHEGNPIQTLYYYEESLNSGGEDCGRVTLFATESWERDIFGAMEGKTIFAVETDDNGFVHGEWIDERRADKLRADHAESLDEESAQ